MRKVKPKEKGYLLWSKFEVVYDLSKKGIEDSDVQKLISENVKGENLETLTELDLKDLDVKLGPRKSIFQAIKELQYEN